MTQESGGHVSYFYGIHFSLSSSNQFPFADPCNSREIYSLSTCNGEYEIDLKLILYHFPGHRHCFSGGHMTEDIYCEYKDSFFLFLTGCEPRTY